MKANHMISLITSSTTDPRLLNTLILMILMREMVTIHAPSSLFHMKMCIHQHLEFGFKGEE